MHHHHQFDSQQYKCYHYVEVMLNEWPNTKHSPSDTYLTHKEKKLQEKGKKREKKGKSLGYSQITESLFVCHVRFSVVSVRSFIFLIILLSVVPVSVYLGSCCHQIHRIGRGNGIGVVARGRVGSCCRHGGKSSGEEGGAGSRVELLW